MFNVFRWNIVRYGIKKARVFSVINDGHIDDRILTRKNASDGLNRDSIGRSDTAKDAAFDVVEVLPFDELANPIKLVDLVVVEPIQNLLRLRSL